MVAPKRSVEPKTRDLAESYCAYCRSPRGFNPSGEQSNCKSCGATEVIVRINVTTYKFK